MAEAPDWKFVLFVLGNQFAKGIRMTKKLLSVLVVACVVLCSSTAEARWWRRGRSSYSYSSNTSVSMTFTGDAQSVCEQKAALQAQMCSMRHLGGSFGGGSFEGVGCSSDPDHALSICCYTGQRVCIGQAVRQGANGMWYACKIFR